MERLIDRPPVTYVTQFTRVEGRVHVGCGDGERKDSDHAKAETHNVSDRETITGDRLATVLPVKTVGRVGFEPTA
jgi:hypothetical protein